MGNPREDKGAGTQPGLPEATRKKRFFSQDREGGEAAGRRTAKSFWQRSGLGLEDIIHGREEIFFP